MDQERRTVDVVSRDADRRRACARCGEPMFERHCKIVCPNCGAFHDCSDP